MHGVTVATFAIIAADNHDDDGNESNSNSNNNKGFPAHDEPGTCAGQEFTFFEHDF